MSTESTTRAEGAPTWGVANLEYLNKELERLRHFLHRRIHWLRTQWGADARQGYHGLVIADEEVDRILTTTDSSEREFYRDDERASKISSAIETLDRELDALGQRGWTAGTPPALLVLGRLFGLTKFERDVVVLCAAPELNDAFERLFAYVQDDATRKYATPHMALALFGGFGEEWIRAKQSLMPQGVLRRMGMLTIDSGTSTSLALMGSVLRLNERISNYLLGVNQIDPHVNAFLRPVPSAPVTGDRDELLKGLRSRIRPGGEQGEWHAVNLIGPPGCGKRALARHLCEQLGLRLVELKIERVLATGPEQQELLRHLEREAVLSQLAVYVDVQTIPRVQHSPDSAWILADVIDKLGVFLLIGSSAPWHTERRTVVFHLDKPNAAGQVVLWREALARTPNAVNGEVNDLVQQFEFGPESIVRIVNSAQTRARLRGTSDDEKLTPEDLWHACREYAGTQLDELAQRIVPCHGWDDIVVPENVSSQLREIAAQVARRAQVYEAWGFGAKLNRGRGINVLFAGASGTGKTLAAEILASHLDLDLFRIDLSSVVSKYIGETEKNLRRVFDAAEQSGAILLFDEADALFGKRSEIKDSHDRYANIEVNYLLQRMEDYRGLAILATNKKSHLDQAFMRRLRFVVDFPFPDAAHRARIWRRVFPKAAATQELDFAALARLEITGGNIKNVALNAAFLAADQDASTGIAHVFQAARREYQKLDKRVSESEFGSHGAVQR